MDNKVESHYIHVENGGIDIDVGETEFGDYFIKMSTQYYGFPYGEFTLGALNTEQLLEISKFLAKVTAKLKLKGE